MPAQHVPDLSVAEQVPVTRHEGLGPTGDGGLHEEVVVRVATQPEAAVHRHEHGALPQERHELRGVTRRHAVVVPEAGPVEDGCELVQQRGARHEREAARLERLAHAGRRAGTGQEAGDPNVRVDDRAG